MIDLSDIAQHLMSPLKGILAADESNQSADEKRLVPYGIATGPEMRRQFRQLFLEAPGIEKYLSGVILYAETMDQHDDVDGLAFPESLKARGIIPGIKVDDGLEPFPESPDESITKGLVDLPGRVAAFKAHHHPSFTKWRATVTIDGDRLPTAQAIVENCKRLALYASEVQKAGMVPILEPEMLLAGKHSRLRAREVLEMTLNALVDALRDQSVDMSGTILKTSMVLSGSGSGRVDTPEEVAEDTVSVLMKTMPREMPGIVFLSGGQTPDQATENLRAIVATARAKHAPWPLTFSYARALQEEALAAWAGKDENIESARAVFLERLAKVSGALS